MAELEKMERNCLEVSFEDVEKYNQNLSTTIIEEYYRYVITNPDQSSCECFSDVFVFF